MSAAALTPRVRALVVSDEAFEHDVESGVYTLEGVRLSVRLRLFLVFGPCGSTCSFHTRAALCSKVR